MYSMRSYGARFIMGEQVDRIENMGDRAVIHLSTGTAQGQLKIEIGGGGGRG